VAIGSLTEAVDALDQGRAFADLSSWRKVLVAGSDAQTWLNDLLSADLAGLHRGGTRRSLLLSPTGRMRADVTVASTGQGLLLIQDPVQPDPIDGLLERYILSSDVALEDRTARLGLLAFPGAAPPLPQVERLRPSALGRGEDLLLPLPAALDEARRAVSHLVEAPPQAVEAWRIRRGVPRFGVDLREDSLPHEAGLDEAIGYHKGCFLGQEAVARVRNLGHPPFVVRAAEGDGPVAPGETLGDGGADAGLVTSAVQLPDGRTAAIVRVRWAARDATLRTPRGTVLHPVKPSTG
jgi:folate-binding protein YgfZ